MEFQLIAPVLIRTSSEPVKIRSASDIPVKRSVDDLFVEYTQCFYEPDSFPTNTISTLCEIEIKKKEKFEANLIDRLNRRRAKCAVCLVTFEDNFTCVACTNKKCSTNVCQSCLFNYVSTAVNDAKYTMPPIRCIGCKQQIPTPTWVTCLRTIKSDLDVSAVESKLVDIMQTCKIRYTINIVLNPCRHKQWFCFFVA